MGASPARASYRLSRGGALWPPARGAALRLSQMAMGLTDRSCRRCGVHGTRVILGIFGLAALALLVAALGDVVLHGQLTLIGPATLVALFAVVLAFVLQGLLTARERTESADRQAAQIQTVATRLEASLAAAAAMNARLKAGRTSGKVATASKLSTSSRTRRGNGMERTRMHRTQRAAPAEWAVPPAWPPPLGMASASMAASAPAAGQGHIHAKSGNQDCNQAPLFRKTVSLTWFYPLLPRW